MNIEYIFKAKDKTQIPGLISSSETGLWSRPLSERIDNYLSVTAHHMDGSVLKLSHCFVRYAKIEFPKTKLILLFPEHINPIYMYLDDIKTVDGMKMVNGKPTLEVIYQSPDI